jgi:hypothetical protein
VAKCDEGYRCQVCDRDVERLVESDLYLRFVIGELDPEVLHTSPERHIRCNPVLAQFIEHDRFDPVKVEGDLSRDSLDPEFVRQRVALVTRGYVRLWELAESGTQHDVTAYPLPEAIEKYRS